MTPADFRSIARYHGQIAIHNFELAKRCAPGAEERFRGVGAMHAKVQSDLEAYADALEGKVTREPTERQLHNLAAQLAEAARLEKLTPRQLINETLNSPVADHAIVTELMNRVLPNWEDAEPGAPETKGARP